MNIINGETAVESVCVLNMNSRNYRLRVSKNNLGYCFSEQSRIKGGELEIQNSPIITDKEKILKRLDCDSLSNDYKINQEKEYNFLCKDIKHLSPEDGEYKIFFYKQTKKMIGDYILSQIKEKNIGGFEELTAEDIVESVVFMEVNLIGEKVSFYEIEYKSQEFNDTIVIDFDFARNYLDIDKLIEISMNLTQDKDLVMIRFILTAPEKFHKSMNIFLYDLPFVIHYHSIVMGKYEKAIDMTEKCLTSFNVFDDNLWGGSYTNFIKE